MVYLWFSSLSFGQHPQGLICQFTEPFYTLRYRFESQILTIESLSMDTYETQVKHLATERKINNKKSTEPKYIIREKGKKESLLLAHKNNKGSDGMSDEVYPYEAQYTDLYGGCAELAEVGTHEVFGTATDKEPWLNLREASGTKGKVIGKLKDGNEIKIMDKQEKWWKAKVISGYDAGKTGWVHSKWLQPIKPSK